MPTGRQLAGNLALTFALTAAGIGAAALLAELPAPVRLVRVQQRQQHRLHGRVAGAEVARAEVSHKQQLLFIATLASALTGGAAVQQGIQMVQNTVMIARLAQKFTP